MELEGLIGKSVTAPDVQDFMKGSNEGPTRDRFAEMEILEFKKRGVSVYLDENQRVVSVFLYGAAADERCQYTGPLPKGLTFSDNQSTVRRKLGVPEGFGWGKQTERVWDRFNCDDVYLHVEYSHGSTSVEMITIMSASMAQGDI